MTALAPLQSVAPSMDADRTPPNYAEAFREVVSTYVYAAHLEQLGRYPMAVYLAIGASELALSTLIPIPPELVGRGKKKIDAYKYRHVRAERWYGISQALLRELHKLRDAARYLQEGLAGPRHMPGEQEANRVLREVKGIIQHLCNGPKPNAPCLALPRELADKVRRGLNRAYDRAPALLALDRLEERIQFGQYRLSALEGRVQSGEKSLSIDAELQIAEREYGEPASDRGEELSALITTLRAIAASNQGRFFGPDGALSLLDRALALWKKHRRAPRVVEALKWKSIVLGILGRTAERRAVVDEILRWVGTDEVLADSIVGEQIGVLRAEQRPEHAVELARRTMGRARHRGDTTRESRTLILLGESLTDRGTIHLVRAEKLLERGAELIPAGYIMAECLAEAALARTRAQAGNANDALISAKRARRIAVLHGYSEIQQRLDSLQDAYPNIALS